MWLICVVAMLLVYLFEFVVWCVSCLVVFSVDAYTVDVV